MKKQENKRTNHDFAQRYQVDSIGFSDLLRNASKGLLMKLVQKSVSLSIVFISVLMLGLPAGAFGEGFE